MTRNRLDRAFRRAHDELTQATLEVYQPSTSFTDPDNATTTAEAGESVTHPDPGNTTPDATVPGRVDSPDSAPDRDPSGTEAEVDAVLRVADDTGVTWTGYGTAGSAPTRVKDTTDGTVYEIQDRIDEHNGLLTLPAVEV